MLNSRNSALYTSSWNFIYVHQLFYVSEPKVAEASEPQSGYLLLALPSRLFIYNSSVKFITYLFSEEEDEDVGEILRMITAKFNYGLLSLNMIQVRIKEIVFRKRFTGPAAHCVAPRMWCCLTGHWLGTCMVILSPAWGSCGTRDRARVDFIQGIEMYSYTHKFLCILSLGV